MQAEDVGAVLVHVLGGHPVAFDLHHNSLLCTSSWQLILN